MSEVTAREFPVLNWVPRFDERSRAYPIRELLRPTLVRKDRLWRPGQILDQGREGACVGFGWTAEALGSPVRVDLLWMKIDAPKEPNAFARNVYHQAQKIDQWEGEAYSGTSVLAGAKVMSSLGLLKQYRWAFSIDDVIDTVVSRGPVVIGIPWYYGMYTAPNGILKVSGSKVGGHCILVVGYKVSDPAFGGEDSLILQNSWGEGWGNKGLARIRKSELAELLKNGGESCVPVQRSYGRLFLSRWVSL